jgi:uncharacterized protein YecE (DUF72 family)
MIRVGTSGWAYKAWQPLFYPEKLPQKRYLEHYSSRLNTVEVNYSFRRFIPESTLANWIAATPPDFLFCVKANQVLTHIKRLKNAQDSLTRFCDSIQPLASAGRLGCVLFQLPPNFKADAVCLDEFLNDVPRAIRSAWEFRHASWFGDKIYDVLRKHNSAMCLAESDELEVPDVHTASFDYFRLRKSDYTAEQIGALAARVRSSAAGEREVFAFMKHEERPESALNAEQLLKLARQEATAA